MILKKIFPLIFFIFGLQSCNTVTGTIEGTAIGVVKDINAKLWVIEDDKRLCEKNSDFTEKFIKLSRDVHFLNDDRAKIKLEMNNHTGSKIKEIKEYTSY